MRMKTLNELLVKEMVKSASDASAEYTRAQIRYGRDNVMGSCWIMQCPTLASGGKIENPNCHRTPYLDGLGCPLTRNKPTKET
jgi:hypothetical protein